MILTKTTTVPPDDPTIILSQPIIKMIVLGDRQAIVQLADDLAQAPPITDRHVIWFKAGLPANYQIQFKVPDLTNVQAFSLSINNTVGDTIRIGENVDEVRIDSAYTKAGE